MEGKVALSCGVGGTVTPAASSLKPASPRCARRRASPACVCSRPCGCGGPVLHPARAEGDGEPGGEAGAEGGGRTARGCAGCSCGAGLAGIPGGASAPAGIPAGASPGHVLTCVGAEPPGACSGGARGGSRGSTPPPPPMPPPCGAWQGGAPPPPGGRAPPAVSPSPVPKARWDAAQCPPAASPHGPGVGDRAAVAAALAAAALVAAAFAACARRSARLSWCVAEARCRRSASAERQRAKLRRTISRARMREASNWAPPREWSESHTWVRGWLRVGGVGRVALRLEGRCVGRVGWKSAPTEAWEGRGVASVESPRRACMVEGEKRAGGGAFRGMRGAGEGVRQRQAGLMQGGSVGAPAHPRPVSHTHTGQPFLSRPPLLPAHLLRSFRQKPAEPPPGPDPAGDGLQRRRHGHHLLLNHTRPTSLRRRRRAPRPSLRLKRGASRRCLLLRGGSAPRSVEGGG